MNDRILQEVKQFLETHHFPGKPLLLGFSGGPDSLALLHLLDRCRRFVDLDLHVAHVDHGWRPESREEAEKLKNEVKFPFYMHHLEGKIKGEEGSRTERLQFFSRLYSHLGCQALILAHHKDDQAETVLKRVLEGAHFLSLGGISPIVILEGMAIWRPLLNLSKQDLLHWIEKHELKPIIDPTNQDPVYLRSRMRTQIFPELAKQFGKEVSGNLHRLGRVAQELKEYLDKKTDSYFKQVKEEEGEEGIVVDLNPLYPFEKIELKVFLKRFSSKYELSLSYDALETLYDLIEKNKSARKLISQGKVIEVHQRTIALKRFSRH